MIVTDEMVARAWDGFMEGYSTDNVFIDGALRAALKAVGPMLVAQGMREAAAMIPGGMIEKGHILSHSNPDVRAIYDRAQELDPK